MIVPERLKQWGLRRLGAVSPGAWFRVQCGAIGILTLLSAALYGQYRYKLAQENIVIERFMIDLSHEREMLLSRLSEQDRLSTPATNVDRDPSRNEKTSISSQEALTEWYESAVASNVEVLRMAAHSGCNRSHSQGYEARLRGGYAEIAALTERAAKPRSSWAIVKMLLKPGSKEHVAGTLNVETCIIFVPKL